MSTLYFFVCDDCKAQQEAGRNGYLWGGPPEALKKRDDWLLVHEGHRLRYISEHYLPDWFDPAMEETS